MPKKGKCCVLLLGRSGYLGAQINYHFEKKELISIVSTYLTSRSQTSEHLIKEQKNFYTN